VIPQAVEFTVPIGCAWKRMHLAASKNLMQPGSATTMPFSKYVSVHSSTALGNLDMNNITLWLTEGGEILQTTFSLFFLQRCRWLKEDE
jgi:hypothetical protein